MSNFSSLLVLYMCIWSKKLCLTIYCHLRNESQTCLVVLEQSLSKNFLQFRDMRSKCMI